MDPTLCQDISELSIKEICSHLRGILAVTRALRLDKNLLLDYILANAQPELLGVLRKAGRSKVAIREQAQELRDNTRKRKRVETENSRRTAARVEEESVAIEHGHRDIHKFLELPSSEEVQYCYRKFWEATSNEALQMTICGVCAREVSMRDDHPRLWPLTNLPNFNRLVPSSPHPAHDLFDGRLLEPMGVEGEGKDICVRVCKQCIEELGKDGDRPPPLSLANNMWIGRIPWQLQVLTFPEQLLIALIYPRVYVFKLFPKKMGGRREALQRAMRGNISSYELSADGIASMLEGRLMPRPPAILASVISVTFIGLEELPKNWLRTTFRVRRHFVAEALRWLKQHNPKYYGNIKISDSRIQQLPDDDVPEEISSLVRQSTDTGIVDQESEGYVPVDEGKFPKLVVIKNNELTVLQTLMP